MFRKRFLFPTLDAVVELLKCLSGTDTTVGISPGDESILLGSARRGSAGDIAAFLASRPPLAEANGIARAMLAAAATGARIHVRQINSKLGVETWTRLRGLADASVETTPQNFFFSSDCYSTAHGASLKASPPFRSQEDVAVLRDALRVGLVDIVATDHAPHTPTEKAASYAAFADIPGGMPGLQTLLQAMLKLVDEGVILMRDIVRVCARNPAERFGLGWRKGTHRTRIRRRHSRARSTTGERDRQCRASLEGRLHTVRRLAGESAAAACFSSRRGDRA
jgi:dihydroorotase